MRVVAALLLTVACAPSASAQNATPTQQPRSHTSVRVKSPAKEPFVFSNFMWAWYQNGLTTFSFSIKNQTGRDVKSLKFRVLFFDRKMEQIDFVDGATSELPSGLARRESVQLDLDTGMSTRKLSTYQKVDVLDWEQKESSPSQ